MGTSLSTPPTLKTVRKLSPLTVKSPTSKSTTAPRLLVMILRRFMEVTPVDMEREMLKLVTKVTLLDLTARTMLITSATRFPSRMRERSQERNARPSLTPPTLKSVRISSMRSVTRPMFRLAIAPRLLVMTPKLLITTPMVMDITRDLLMLNQKLRLIPDMVDMVDIPIPQDQSATTMWRRSATRDQNRSTVKSAMRNMTSLLTPPTLKSVRRLSPLTVRNNTPRSTTAPRLLVMILRRFMEVTQVDMEREMLKLVTKVTLLDLTARTMLITSATRFPSRMRERSQERSARPLLTPPTLKSVRKSLSLSARSTTRRFTTAPRLLVMTHMLLIITLMDMDIINAIDGLNCN